jgi:hypothetical protein
VVQQLLFELNGNYRERATNANGYVVRSELPVQKHILLCGLAILFIIQRTNMLTEFYGGIYQAIILHKMTVTNIE